jgi:hypothetical protein
MHIAQHTGADAGIEPSAGSAIGAAATSDGMADTPASRRIAVRRLKACMVQDLTGSQISTVPVPVRGSNRSS